MHIKISFLSATEIFLGLRFSITNIVSDVKKYDIKLEYPKAYTLEIGLIFINIDLMKKGRI